MKYKKISDKKFKKDTLKLSKKILSFMISKQWEKEKTVIVGVARGGLIPAQLIAYQLGLRYITSVQSIWYQEGSTAQLETQEIFGIYSIDFERFDNYILVDDIHDTGTTLFNVGEIILDTGVALADKLPNLIKAVVYTHQTKQEAQNENIFYGKRIKKISGEKPWLIFPWDKK